MPSRRLEEARDPVEITHDGDVVIAERGEPLAAALIAADRVPLGRSPKLHRPRAAYCLRGSCDGCLVRLNGEPNVLGCRVPARGGEKLETQNVLGARDLDVLRAGDFVFPNGLDHHRLLAGVPGASSLVTGVARQLAGLGRLPSATPNVTPTSREECDVLVVGGGSSGLELAARLGARALVVDDGLLRGGSMAALDASRAAERWRSFERSGARWLGRATALGVYREPETEAARWCTLVVDERMTRLVFPRDLVLATGHYEPVLAFPNNDLPGVVSARAAAMLAAWNITPGERLLLVGAGRFLDALRAGPLAPYVVAQVGADDLVAARGRSRVRAAVVRDGARTTRMAVDAIVVDGPSPPALELLVQAGGRVRFDATLGFVAELDDQGRAAPHVYAVGSAAAPQGHGSVARVAAALSA